MTKPMPPLLALAQGRRVRLRKVPAMQPKELQLHLAVAGLLRRHARPDWRWCHYPAGEERDARLAAKLKAMGLAAGLPDILLFDPSGRLHGLELKRAGEELSEEQQLFHAWMITHGIPRAVAESPPQALLALRTWGALRDDVPIGGAP